MRRSSTLLLPVRRLGPAGLVFLLALLSPIGCGRDRGETPGAQAPSQATQPNQLDQSDQSDLPNGGVSPAEAPPTTASGDVTDDSGTAPAPSTTTAATGESADDLAAQKAELAERERRIAEREALARKQKELDEREARLARQEAAAASQPSHNGAAAAPTPAPGQKSDDPEDLASAPPADTSAGSDEDWRRSQHRTDRAAREGYDPAAGAEPETYEPAGDGAMDEAAEPAPAAPAPREPEVTWRSELLPSGTRFTVELEQTIASDRSHPGDTFRARVVQDVTRGGEVMIPAGTVVMGRVTEAVPLSQQVGGRARLGLEFYSLRPPGAQPAPISADFAAKGKSETAKDAATIGGAAAAGAILGRVLNRGDKGKGSVLGAIIGAAAGTAIASHTEGEEVTLPEGAQVELVLTQPAQVPVRQP